MRCAALVLSGLVVACSGGDDRPRIQRDPQRPRRIIEPPTGEVRPLPPHAIRIEGVGPYRLDERLDLLLEQLPSGPRVASFDIPNLVRRSLIRAEDDTVLIGGSEPTGVATFVAVIGPDVARTESGIHVGSTRDEIAHALGPFVEELDHARDPRLAATTQLRNLRVIFEGDRASALVVSSDLPRSAAEPSTCIRPVSTPKAFGACLGGGPTGELVEVNGDAIQVGDSRAVVHVPNLVFAAPLRNLVDGRDELVVVSRTDEIAQRSWSLTAFRLDGARLQRTIEPTPLYQLSSLNARWIGADLRDVELYLELSSRLDAVEVGGLLTTKTNNKIRDVVAISPVVVPRRHAKPPTDLSDAGVPDPAAAAKQKPAE